MIRLECCLERKWGKDETKANVTVLEVLFLLHMPGPHESLGGCWGQDTLRRTPLPANLPLGSSPVSYFLQKTHLTSWTPTHCVPGLSQAKTLERNENKSKEDTSSGRRMRAWKLSWCGGSQLGLLVGCPTTMAMARYLHF